ncbi:YezD family protein [Bacillus sp. JJ1533]|uniref:YezD family protein n=1 Tax=Bacillus sp. JJ1533 TaxID=3122959 RepID=UPI002FFF35CA
MAKLDESKVKHILSTLEKLDFGSIVITVHDGEITQIDATEKKRFSLQKSTSTQKLSKNTK